MGKKKTYNGYKAYDYLDVGLDYKEFKLTRATDRVPPYIVPLSKNEEERLEEFIEKNVIIDLHEHPILWPDDMSEAFELNRMGRDSRARAAGAWERQPGLGPHRLWLRRRKTHEQGRDAHRRGTHQRPHRHRDHRGI
jgi:hypothetical protein